MKKGAWRETRQVKYRERKPWVRHVEFARRRVNCTDREGKYWPIYGAKGIKCDLTAAMLERVWHRDGAADMRKPSLDRIESDKDYTIGNVRFLEHLVNSRRPHEGIATRLEDLTPDPEDEEVPF